MLRHALSLHPEPWIPADTLMDDMRDPWPDNSVHQKIVAHPMGHTGRFRAAVRDGTLELTADILKPDGWNFTPRQDSPEWYNHDHIVVFLDPAHDHATQRMIAVTRAGDVHVSDKWLLNGEEASDIQTKPLELPPISPDVRVVELPETHAWRVRIRIELARLAPASSTVRYPDAPIGLRVKFGIEAPVLHPAPSWPETHPFWGDSPLNFGDLTAPDPSLIMRKTDFGKPVWTTGNRRSTLTLSADITGLAITGGVCAIAVTDTLGHVSSSETVEWTCDAGAFTVTIPVDYPFESKWAPDTLRIGRVGVEVRDASGGMIWAGEYPYGFDAAVIVREPFDLTPPAGETPSRPLASDPDFVNRFRAWLLMILPDWALTTTRDGSPSDFFLKDPKAGHDIDLMSPTLYADLAALIHSLFDDWQDALCAASMLLHHPVMTVHSGSWARVSGGATTEAVLRVGGCFCNDCARIAARLAEELGKEYGVPLTGYSLGLRGHLTGLVETPIGEVLIDPMLGAYYHTLDNTRLATLDEMREDIRIQRRMWLLAYNHGHEFFYKVYNQMKAPWQDGVMAYPITDA